MGNAMITGQTGAAGSSEVIIGTATIDSTNIATKPVVIAKKKPVKGFIHYISTLGIMPFQAELIDGTTYTLYTNTTQITIYLKVTATSLEFYRTGSNTGTHGLYYLFFF